LSRDFQSSQEKHKKGSGLFARRPLERKKSLQSGPQAMAGGVELGSGQNPVSLGHDGKGEFGESEEEACANLSRGWVGVGRV
jgi:hypothetical protein